MVQETIHKTTDLLEHMAQTIEVFRDFYRPDKEKTAFRISDSVDNALTFISPALKNQSIAVELDVDPDLLATGYPREYIQVLLNVLSNARDALKERKTEKPKIMIKGIAEGNRAVVTITDNAGGIPESIVSNIFDLYVTTKEASGGTGIGLHMSKNIIEKNMHGSLTAHNTDSGAQFRIAVNMPDRGAL
jgi:C4-dicarboxylate-specific signal transduction histidine kinase